MGKAGTTWTGAGTAADVVVRGSEDAAGTDALAFERDRERDRDRDRLRP